MGRKCSYQSTSMELMDILYCLYPLTHSDVQAGIPLSLSDPDGDCSVLVVQVPTGTGSHLPPNTAHCKLNVPRGFVGVPVGGHRWRGSQPGVLLRAARGVDP